MKGFLPLFLGIFGTFAFSWAGLIVLPNAQIGHLDPQMDEEGNDAYPAPKSGMADRGRRVYVGNGCVYCHSQQVRPDYAASDIDRKWGERRSAPRDYLFERPALLGKMRMGPDLSNIGKRAPADDQNAPAPGSTSSTTAAPGAAPDAAGSTPPTPAPGAPAPATGAAVPPEAVPDEPAIAAPPSSTANVPPAAAEEKPAPAQSPAKPPAAGETPAPAARETAAAAASAAGRPAESPAAPPATGDNAASPAPAVAAQTQAVAVAPTTDAIGGAAGNEPLPYSAAWHHRHLYQPRSITPDSNMPSYRFLYEKRRTGGQPSVDALKFSAPGLVEQGWEIVPSYEAKCLVAYLMALDQSHALNEVKSSAPVSPPAPGKAPK